MVCRLIRFVSMKFFNAGHELNLIMTSTGLFPPSIHFISVIFFRSYDSFRHMISTISRFSCVLPNLTRQSYNDLKSVQMIMKRKICKIFSTVDFRIDPTSKFWAIANNSEIKTFFVTFLHLVDDQ